ncbi:MAG: universal stress protein [Promethearchaeota archaeon]|jgi:nucleotide-binding universal stress UspA family protein
MNRAAAVIIGFYKTFESEITIFHSIKHMLKKVSPSAEGLGTISSIYPSLNLTPIAVPMTGTPVSSTPMLSEKIRSLKKTRLTEQEVKEIGLGILEDKKAIFSEVQVPVKTKLIFKEEPEDYILRIVPKKNYNLVVVGNTGLHSTLGKIFIGSVSKRIVANCPCDVLVIK